MQTKRRRKEACPAELPPSSLEALWEARRCAKEKFKNCASNYWMNLCAEIQSAADTGNLRGMFEGITKPIGPTQSKCAPLKTSTGETITDNSKLMECWVEHYSELYGGMNSVSLSVLNNIERLPTLFELDDAPTKDELSNAINDISSGKVPGQYGILAEVFKYGGSQLLHNLHQLFCRCWEERSIPQEMRDNNLNPVQEQGRLQRLQ